MKVAVFYSKNNLPYETAQSVISQLTSLDVEVLMLGEDKGAFSAKNITFTSYENAVKQCDVVIAVGGDGTVIKHSVYAGLCHKPVLGINAGRLGFLSGLEKTEMELLSELVEGSYEKKSRMLLKAQVINDKKVIFESYCLNDAVVKSEGARLVDFEVTSDGKKVSTYRADGVIFATPTGSTAYSLSAGGPVVDPKLECMIMTPVCAHSFISRSVIFDTENELQVRCANAYDKKLQLSLDGNEPVSVGTDEYINIKKADISVEFITLKQQNFYEVLNNKMIEKNF